MSYFIMNFRTDFYGWCLAGLDVLSKLFAHFYFYFFSSVGTVLKGIIYPLAAKSTQVLDLAHQKNTQKNVLLSGVFRVSSLPS